MVCLRISSYQWHLKGMWNVAVRTKVYNVWTNKGETKKKKTYRESLKDFLENKNQPIELSAKIESISIIIVHRQKLDKTYYDNTIALRRL